MSCEQDSIKTSKTEEYVNYLDKTFNKPNNICDESNYNKDDCGWYKSLDDGKELQQDFYKFSKIKLELVNLAREFVNTIKNQDTEAYDYLMFILSQANTWEQFSAKRYSLLKSYWKQGVTWRHGISPDDLNPSDRDGDEYAGLGSSMGDILIIYPMYKIMKELINKETVLSVGQYLGQVGEIIQCKKGALAENLYFEIYDDINPEIELLDNVLLVPQSVWLAFIQDTYYYLKGCFEEEYIKDEITKGKEIFDNELINKDNIDAFIKVLDTMINDDTSTKLSYSIDNNKSFKLPNNLDTTILKKNDVMLKDLNNFWKTPSKTNYLKIFLPEILENMQNEANTYYENDDKNITTYLQSFNTRPKGFRRKKLKIM